MSILPKETIQVIAQSIGINNLPDDVAAALAPDVEYRMREVMQEAVKCMLHSKRTTLTTDDVNSALQLQNIEPLYGFASGGPLKFKRALGHTDLFYVDDGLVELKDVIEASLPKAPIDTAVVAHWLAIEGVQPTIPENAPLQKLVPSLDSIKPETVITRKKDEDLAVEVKLPVKHVLSRELQLYFEKITELVVKNSDSALFMAALSSLATDSGLHPLVPYFTQFIAEEVTRGLDDLPLLYSLMRVVRSLLLNPHIQIEPYLHQLMPSVMTCLVAKRLGSKAMEGHWELRDYTANLIAFICKQFGRAYHNLQPRVTKTLLHAFLDPKRSMTQHYGAIKGLAALGSRIVSLLILPNLEAYLHLLVPEMSFETQKNEMKRYEATRVYGALLNAVGLCMATKLKSCPVLFSSRIWNPSQQGKFAAPSHKTAVDGLPTFSQSSQVTSPSRMQVTEADGSSMQEKMLIKNSSPKGDDSIPDSALTCEAQLVEGDISQESAKVSSEVVNNTSKMEEAKSVKSVNSSRALAEAWKEDAELGPLLASLFALFGDGILPFVPNNELSMFI